MTIKPIKPINLIDYIDLIDPEFISIIKKTQMLMNLFIILLCVAACFLAYHYVKMNKKVNILRSENQRFIDNSSQIQEQVNLLQNEINTIKQELNKPKRTRAKKSDGEFTQNILPEVKTSGEATAEAKPKRRGRPRKVNPEEAVAINVSEPSNVNVSNE